MEKEQLLKMFELYRKGEKVAINEVLSQTLDDDEMFVIKVRTGKKETVDIPLLKGSTRFKGGGEMIDFWKLVSEDFQEDEIEKRNKITDANGNLIEVTEHYPFRNIESITIAKKETSNK